jgi:hypothetical protein
VGGMIIDQPGIGLNLLTRIQVDLSRVRSTCPISERQG